MDDMEPLKILIEEHKTIQKMVKILKLLQDDPQKIEKVDSSFLEKVVDFFRIYADRCHHGKEEKILFGRLQKKPLSMADRSLMNELIEEHKVARGFVAALDKLKTRQNPQAIAKIFSQITSLYEPHIEKENRRFFLPAFSYFSPEEIEEVLRDFFEEDRKVIHEKYLKVVEDINLSLNLE
jgi:hemerythrin-like domain-containing protein